MGFADDEEAAVVALPDDDGLRSFRRATAAMAIATPSTRTVTKMIFKTLDTIQGNFLKIFRVEDVSNEV